MLRDHIQGVNDRRVCGTLWLAIDQRHALGGSGAKLAEPAATGQDDWD